jgi:sec-independent protein translocase protein TatA
MFGLGVPELIFILLLALLIFGPKRLPEIGRTLGKGMSEFRKASNELTRSLNTELALDETPEPPAVRANRMEALRAPRAEAPAAEAEEAPAPVSNTPIEPS